MREGGSEDEGKGKRCLSVKGRQESRDGNSNFGLSEDQLSSRTPETGCVWMMWPLKAKKNTLHEQFTRTQTFKRNSSLKKTSLSPFTWLFGAWQLLVTIHFQNESSSNIPLKILFCIPWNKISLFFFMTGKWVNNDRSSFFVWTLPLKSHCSEVDFDFVSLSAGLYS